MDRRFGGSVGVALKGPRMASYCNTNQNRQGEGLIMMR